MAVTNACPEPAVLRRLLLGELPPSELEPLGEHLVQCDRCAGTLNGLRPVDALLQALRGATTPAALDPRVQTLIDRLSRLPGGTNAATVSDLPPAAGVDGSSGFGFLTPPQGPDELGRLGGYRVLKMLGRGGMGAVFLAEDPQLERRVALKVMLPELAAKPGPRRRFLREAKATAKLKDDYIVAIYQVGEDNGVPFLAMEYLRGESLESWLERGKQLSVGQLLRVARDVTRGLAAAHAKGLIHRDIKPANLWLEAPKGRVKILDFGLARGDKEELRLTQSGTVLGTPAYMAPEQADGEPADARSDLFSLGCVLYRLCTGQLPFQGPTVMSILTALVTTNPAPVRQVNPQIPETLAELVMRLLAKRREDRPASAQAVLQELQAILQQNAQPPRPNVPATSAPPRRSVPWKRVAIGILAPICVILLAAQVVIRIRHKDGSETKIEVPKDSEVIVEDKGKVVIKVPNETAKAKPAVVGDPHRRLAEMVLNHEGTLTVRTAKEVINVAGMKDLPKEPFLVANIRAGSKPIPNQAMEAFEGIHDVPDLVLTLADEAGLRHLRDVAVQQITLNGEKLNGDECVKLLGERPDLLHLTLGGSSISDAAVPLLLRMKRLRALYLTGDSKLTDAGIKALARHPALGFVGIHAITPEAAGLFNQLPFLRYIGVDKVDDAAVTSLLGLTRAAAVAPYGNLSDDAARRLQKALPNAVILHSAIPPSEAERSAFQWALDQKAHFGGFMSWNVPIKEVPTSAILLGMLSMPDDLRTGASHLRGIRCVHSLRWFGLNNADEEAEHLATLDSLLGLWLAKTTLTARGMERLTALKRLEGLHLMQIPTITTEALSYIPKFEQLSGMAINGSPVTDSGLAELAKAKGLQDLTLEWCTGPFTGGGLRHLASLPLLRHLKLDGTPLDASSVGSLKLLTSLRVLEVKQTQLVAADIAELHKALPKCAIVWDGGLIVPGMEGEREAKQP